jgi:APA family basic amino acid/polyamine antiporter
VAVAAIGAKDWQWFGDSEAALVQILDQLTGQAWIAVVFAVGAVLAICSVVLTVLYGQTRILLTMSRDGLVPAIFGRVSPKTGTPVAGTWIVGVLVALTAAFVPLGALADATSIGTLFAFALVNVAVIILRVSRPGMARTYRVPLFPIVPVLGALTCAFLMANLDGVTWLVFGAWMGLGIAFYFAYGRRNSRVGTQTASQDQEALA